MKIKRVIPVLIGLLFCLNGSLSIYASCSKFCVGVTGLRRIPCKGTVYNGYKGGCISPDAGFTGYIVNCDSYGEEDCSTCKCAPPPEKRRDSVYLVHVLKTNSTK